MNIQKKSLLFFVSLLLFGLTSCSKDDKVPSTPPTASFEVEVNELTVSFNNTSTGAVSYIWSFGDDSKTSTEVDPTHTYNEEGTYEVELFATNDSGTTKSAKMSVTVEVEDGNGKDPMPKFTINLDGEFDDWADIAEEHFVGDVLDEAKSDYHRLKEVKLIADANYIYMYMKMDIEHANAMDIYMNIDGSTETGYNSWMWNQPSANYMMQGFYKDNYDMRLASYDESKGGGWGWQTPNIVETGMGLMELSEMKQVSGNIYEFEARISLKLIPKLEDYVRIMIGHSGTEDDAWSTSGGMPTVTNAGDKNDGLLLRLK